MVAGGSRCIVCETLVAAGALSQPTGRFKRGTFRKIHHIQCTCALQCLVKDYTNHLLYYNVSNLLQFRKKVKMIPAL